MAIITTAGERLIAEKLAARQGLLIEHFVLAHVPELDSTAPIDRDAAAPAAEHIVHRTAVTQAGFVNPNQVVYSLMLGSEVGDFDWNWIALESAEGVLVSVAHVPLQQKRKNIPPHQVGNNVTRNFMLLFDGAQALTEVKVDASTWQHDFTVRLRGIDGREQLSNRDFFGDALFYNAAFALTLTDGKLSLQPGLAYLNGIRVTAAEALPVEPATYPNTLWLDVVLRPEGAGDVVAHCSPLWGAEVAASFTDSAGLVHARARIADLADATTIKDRRTVLRANGGLIHHLAARVGDYPKLRARATTKEDVGLSQLPNAKSDDPANNSSEVLATTAALAHLQAQISDSLVGMVAPFAMVAAPAGWLKCNGTAVSRITFAKLFAAVGTTYGAGDGTVTFNLPDLRGRFLRGWSDGAGLDAGRVIGSHQDWQNGSHNHSAGSGHSGDHAHGAGSHNAGHHSHSGSTAGAGEHSHNIKEGDIGWGGADEILTSGDDMTRAVRAWSTSSVSGHHAHGLHIDGTGEHSHGIVVHAAGNHAHPITVNHAGGNESRPFNTALLYCIKF